METFPFDYHIPSTEYPDEGSRLQLGDSYTFSVGASAPPQRIITLEFKDSAMRNFWDSANNKPDIVTNANRNFFALELFYQRHKLHNKFTYVHPQYGAMTVTFNKPLKTPKMVDGRPGEMQGFSVELLEHP